MLHVVSHHALAVIYLYHTFSFSLLACDYSKHFSRQVGGKQRRSVHLQTLGSAASLNYVLSLSHVQKIKTQWNFISVENSPWQRGKYKKAFLQKFQRKGKWSCRLHVKLNIVSAWLCNFDIITGQFPLTIEANHVSVSIQIQTGRKLIWLFIQHQFSTSEKAIFYTPEKCENNYLS